MTWDKNTETARKIIIQAGQDMDAVQRAVLLRNAVDELEASIAREKKLDRQLDMVWICPCCWVVRCSRNRSLPGRAWDGSIGTLLRTQMSPC